MEIKLPANAIAVGYSGVDDVIQKAVCLAAGRRMVKTNLHLNVNPNSKDFGMKKSVSIFSTSRETVDYIESLVKKPQIAKIWAVLDNYTCAEIYDRSEDDGSDILIIVE